MFCEVGGLSRGTCLLRKHPPRLSCFAASVALVMAVLGVFAKLLFQPGELPRILSQKKAHESPGCWRSECWVGLGVRPHVMPTKEGSRALLVAGTALGAMGLERAPGCSGAQVGTSTDSAWETQGRVRELAHFMERTSRPHTCEDSVDIGSHEEPGHVEPWCPLVRLRGGQPVPPSELFL